MHTVIPDDSTKLQIKFLADPIPYLVRLLLVGQLSKKHPLPANKDEKGYWAGIFF